jgi:hypothetical protein
LDLVRALAAVHSAGLVHRDVKASNVMREAGGRIVLTDFGTVVDAARLARPEELLVGTAHYMAPEALRGEQGGKPADIYALGVVLYRLVSARYPMEATTLCELLDRHKKGAATPLREARPDLPAAFVRIVERTIAADPALRYANVGEMERELATFLGQGTPSHRPIARGRTTFVAVAVALVLAAAWLGWNRWGGADSLTMRCDLFRTTEGATERLGEGQPVAVGDHLFLVMETSREAWVYVFNEDDAGNVYLLFPLTAMDVANPLRAGQRWRLPGRLDDVERTWDVDTAGGRERLFVVGSTRPLHELEQALAGVPEAGMAKPVSAEILHRGIGGLGRMGATPGPAPRLSDLFTRIAETTGDTRGLFTWWIDLENPRP